MRSCFTGFAVLSLSCVFTLVGCSGPSDPAKADYWVYRLDSEKERDEAFKKLGELKDPSAVDPLVKYMTENVKERANAAVALGAIGDKKAIPGLVALLDFEAGAGSDDAARGKNRNNEKIAQALGQLQATEAADALLKLFKSRDNYVRLAAVKALGEVKTKAAIPALTDVVRNDDNMFLKKTAVEALGNIGDAEAVPVLIEALFIEKGASLYPQASYALVQVGPAAIGPLTETLTGKNAAVTKMATDKGFMEGAIEAKCAEVLGDLRAQKAEEILLRMFRETQNPIIQSKLALALGRLGTSKSVDTLVKASATPAGDLREYFVDALNELSDRAAIPSLLAGSKTNDVDARRVSFRALSRLGDAREFVAAEALTKGKDEIATTLAKEMPRFIAAKECGDNVDCWLGKLKDKDGKVRDRAAYALGRIRDKKAGDALAAAIKDDDLEARYAIIWALDKVGNKTHIPALEKVVKDESGKLQFIRINEDLKRLIINLNRG